MRPGIRQLKTFEKPQQSSRRTDHIRPFYVMDLLARAKQLEQAGRSILHLEVGEPDFPTAQPIIDAGIQALEALKTHYTPALGLPELRAAIAAHYQRKFGITVDPGRVVVTTGASGALQLALAALVDVGDKVLLPDPGYPCNRNIAKILAAESVNIPVNPDTHYQLNAELINQSWDKGTRAAMVASPSNPTGTLMPKTQMRALIEAIAEQGGHLIVDEIYQGLVYDAQDYTALAFSNDVFVINSFSKYFGMTGWRLGWMVVPEAFIDAVDRVAQNLFLAAPTVAQHAALAAFEVDTETILLQRVQTFKQRRDYLLPALRDIGFDVPVTPQGAFYIYADCSAFTQDSFSWTHDLLEQQGVAVTPGIDFGDFEAGTHVRFAYTRPIEVLQSACERIIKHIN